jgi:1-acyl-sn-glycerol-3-phosphate acyltransferase
MIQRWLRSGPCNAARAILQDLLLVPALRTYCAPYRARRSRTVEANRPVVIVANHASHLDAPAILAALPHRMRHRTAIAAADDYFYRQPVLGFAVSLGMGTFPFPRHGNVGLECAAELLGDGWNILIFPEGTRSPDGGLHEFRAGVGRLVKRSGAAVLPVGIVGAHSLWPRTRKLPRRGPLEVRVGESWTAATTDPPERIADELMHRVALLIGDNP